MTRLLLSCSRLVPSVVVLVAMASGARAQERATPTVQVHSPCGPEWTSALEHALEVELATSRLASPRCESVRVEAMPETCGGEGLTRLSIRVGDESETLLEAARGPLRALAVAAAEQVARARAACEFPPEAAWEDLRPTATDADRQLYYAQMDHGIALTRRRDPGTVLARVRVAPLADVARGGFGLLGDASLTAWLGEGLWMRADLGPAGVAVGDAAGIGLLGGSAMLGYDTGGFAFAVGGGAGLANGVGQVDVLGRVDLYLRLGYEPSVFGSVRVSLGVAAERVEFGLVSARFAVPVDPRVAVVWNAEVGIAFASGRLDVGVQAWLLGDAATSSGLALEAGLGVGALAFVPTCALGPCEDEWTIAIGPSAHLGLVIRAGP